MPPESAAPAKAAEPAQGKPRRAYMRADDRRRLILAAAQQVFARSNLQGARTRDIAKAADVTEATLFQHFPSKEALFQAAVIEPLLETMRGSEERARIYEAAGLPVSDAARAELDAYRLAHPRGKDGQVVYDLRRDFDAEPDDVRAAFGFYHDAFPVRVEVR